MESAREKRAWSVVKRARSFAHAIRGIKVFLGTTPNVWIHILAMLVVVALGFYFEVSILEWLILVLTIGFVVAAEAFNTAIEIDIDLTSPEYHPYARDTKDVAAGAVLISAIVSVIVGLIIFLPKILSIF